MQVVSLVSRNTSREENAVVLSILEYKRDNSLDLFVAGGVVGGGVGLKDIYKHIEKLQKEIEKLKLRLNRILCYEKQV